MDIGGGLRWSREKNEDDKVVRSLLTNNQLLQLVFLFHTLLCLKHSFVIGPSMNYNIYKHGNYSNVYLVEVETC